MLGLFALLVGTIPAIGRESEGARANSVLLNGMWEFVRGTGDENAQTAAGWRKLEWRTVKRPGPFIPWSQETANNTKCVWARRSFTVTSQQARSLAVLRWNRIACGAEAFINGQKVGENEPNGPFQVLVPPGVLQPGTNDIVLKVRGAAGVRKSRSSYTLIPAGFGAGLPEVTDDVWIDFADAGYMKWVLAVPDLNHSRVRIRVTPTSLAPLDDLHIIAQANAWPNGKTPGEAQAVARSSPNPDPLGGEDFFVEVPMPGFQAWSHENCPLYLAQVTLTRRGRVLDEVNFRFGTRDPEPNALEGVDRVADLGHLQMKGAFAGLDLLVGIAVAIATEQAVRVALVMITAQELGHFEFDRFLEHELSAQADGFGERCSSGVGAQELFFEGLAGELAFHGCSSLSVWPGQIESAPSWLLQEA